MTGPATAPSSCVTSPSPSAAVRALRSGSLVVDSGSIHALVGENGAGKSTLVKIVAGVHQRDAGTFRFHGEDVDFGSTAESKAAGIAVIYQEPTLFPDLSVTENIFMGRQPLGRGAPDRPGRDVRRGDRSCSTGSASRIDPRRPARGLSIADQQIIEIAKAISLDAGLLVMDEPTAALSGVEVERLFAVARSLRDEGRALVFISHRFDEVFALCDTVTVMRDGEYVSTDAVADTSVDEIVPRMVGREVGDLFPKTDGRGRRRGARGRRPHQRRHLPRRLLLRARRRDRRPGRPGRRRPQRDRARRLRRRPLRRRHASGWPAATYAGTTRAPPIRAGIAFVPEDRRKQGLVTESSVARNVAGVIRGRLTHAGLLTNARREPRRRPLGRPARGEDQRARHARHHHERRQPAEGRARQVAGHRAEAADHRRADPRHRHRHQGRGAPAAVGPRRTGHRHLDDLLRAPRGARHVRPGARRLRGPDHRRARPRRRHARDRHACRDRLGHPLSRRDRRDRRRRHERHPPGRAERGSRPPAAILGVAAPLPRDRRSCGAARW